MAYCTCLYKQSITSSSPYIKYWIFISIFDICSILLNIQWQWTKVFIDQQQIFNHISPPFPILIPQYRFHLSENHRPNTYFRVCVLLFAQWDDKNSRNHFHIRLQLQACVLDKPTNCIMGIISNRKRIGVFFGKLFEVMIHTKLPFRFFVSMQIIQSLCQG